MVLQPLAAVKGNEDDEEDDGDNIAAGDDRKSSVEFWKKLRDVVGLWLRGFQHACSIHVQI